MLLCYTLQLHKEQSTLLPNLVEGFRYWFSPYHYQENGESIKQ
ncbi:hypothetical protein SAMN04487909_103348 [Aneurinibacillus migulanus]|uniref:Uncharacterized protein n=1 Tax=Aneurinibacillus migulanus TaxID=47500 RepID=A0A1G8KA29_ANEMI|nr:hypothetical protein SAMN04487909_103348 [Aneurinibacillus migulanus]